MLKTPFGPHISGTDKKIKIDTFIDMMNGAEVLGSREIMRQMLFLSNTGDDVDVLFLENLHRIQQDKFSDIKSAAQDFVTRAACSYFQIGKPATDSHFSSPSIAVSVLQRSHETLVKIKQQATEAAAATMTFAIQTHDLDVVGNKPLRLTVDSYYGRYSELATLVDDAVANGSATPNQRKRLRKILDAKQSIVNGPAPVPVRSSAMPLPAAVMHYDI